MTKDQISAIMARAACLCGYTKSQHLGTQAYLMAIIGGIDPSASSLVPLSACFLCGSKQTQDLALAFIIQETTGATGTPQQIIASEPCIQCIPPGSYEAFKTAALWQIALNDVPGAPTTPAEILDDAGELTTLEPDIIISVLIFVHHEVGGSPIVPPAGEPTAESMAQAQAWSAQVVVNGGAAPSVNTVRAVAFLYDDLKAAGTFGKFHTLAIFVPDNLTAARTPVISNSGDNPYTNNGFVGADLNTYGLKGDGTSKSLDTGVSLNVVNPTDLSMVALVDDAPILFGPGGVNLDMGVRDQTSSDSIQLCAANQTIGTGSYYGCFADMPVDALAGRAAAANVMPAYICGSRSAANLQKLFIANKWNPHFEAASNSNTPTQFTVDVTFTFFGRKTSVTDLVDMWSPRRMKAAGLATSFTITESSAVYDALLACRQRLEDGVTTYAQDWAIRVQKNGGSAPSAATVTALNTFMSTIETAGLLPKFDTINAMVPGSGIAGIQTPLFRRWGMDPYISVGTYANVNATINGLQGKPASRLDSGLVYGTATRLGQNTGITLYLPAPMVGAAFTHICSSSATQYQILFQAPNTFIWDSPFNAGTGRILVNSAILATPGYYHCMRDSNVNANLYVANSVKAHQLAGNQPTATPALLAGDTALFPIMGDAGNVSFYEGLCSFFAVGQALTLAESATLYNAVQALRVSLGGGFA